MRRSRNATPGRTFEERSRNVFAQALSGRRVFVSPEAHNRAFVERWKLTVDGQPFDWGLYAPLAGLHEDDHPEMVIMAAAQTGKSIYLVLSMMRSALRYPGSAVIGYWPTQDLAREISSTRWDPLLKSSPELCRTLKDAGTGSVKRKERAGMDVVTVAGTPVFFRYTGPAERPARATTESTSAKAIYFDEVRRLPPPVVELAERRTSAHVDFRRFYGSTAGSPGLDIDRYFQAGDQRYWHSVCGCDDGCVLSLSYPDCIEDLRGASFTRQAQVRAAFEAARLPLYGLPEKLADRYAAQPACYVCPACGEIIANPRLGWWEAHNPGVYAHSYQMPAFLAPSQPAPRVLNDVLLATDKGEVQRSIVGRPYVDEGEIYVKEAELHGCINPEARWWAFESGGPLAATHKRRVAGVDVQVGYLVLVIGAVMGKGEIEIQHLEIIHDPNIERGEAAKHWDVLLERLIQWRVKVVVIDNMPEPSQVAILVQRLKALRSMEGGISIAAYGASERQLGGTDGHGPMVTWGDEKNDEAEKGAPQTTRHQVVFNRTTAHMNALARWRQRLNHVPPLAKMVQRLPVEPKTGQPHLTADLRNGRWETVCIGDLFFRHMRACAFVMNYPNGNPVLGTGKLMMQHVGVDPHFAHAYLYMCAAGLKIDTHVMQE